MTLYCFRRYVIYLLNVQCSREGFALMEQPKFGDGRHIQIIKYNSVANAWMCLFGVIDLNFKCRIRRGQRIDDIWVESPAVPRHHRAPLRNCDAATRVRVCQKYPQKCRSREVSGYPSNRRKAWQTKCEAVAVLGRGSNTTSLLSYLLLSLHLNYHNQ